MMSCLTQLDGTQRGPHVKSAPDRGGMVANVTFINITMVNIQQGLSITEFYDTGVGYPPRIYVRLTCGSCFWVSSSLLILIVFNLCSS